MIHIYHNTRCSKSRNALAILQESGKDFKIIEYLKEPLFEKDIKELLVLLDIPATDLVRKNEAIWKAHYKGKDMTEQEIITAMATHPKLIERPIVVVEGKAVIARPTEKIHTIL